MATSTRRRTEGGGPGSAARGQRAARGGRGRGPESGPDPGSRVSRSARRSPTLPAHGGASTGPIPAPSRGRARGLWPRRVGGGEGGPLLPHRVVGGAGQPGWRKRSKVTAQGARTPHRHAGPVHGCHTATRAAARHPRAPHALPAPPGPCAQAQPLGASCWRLPGPRRSRQNAHPPTSGRTVWAVGVTPRGGPVPPSRSGADGAGASLGTPSALHDTLTLQASGGRDAGPGLRLTKTHARHSKERRNWTSEQTS